MSAIFTKSMARNVFFGGGVFFFLLFLALTFDSMKVLPTRDNSQNITAGVEHGKKIWETNNCIGGGSFIRPLDMACVFWSSRYYERS